jgi:hypothetical protein
MIWRSGSAAGERPALARALSLAERDAGRRRRADRAPGGAAGPGPRGRHHRAAGRRQVHPGRRHGAALPRAGQRVAVLAVDPSSPVSGGALLGDRFRIGESADDDRSFVRSTATRGSLGGLTAAARQMVRPDGCRRLRPGAGRNRRHRSVRGRCRGTRRFAAGGLPARAGRRDAGDQGRHPGTGRPAGGDQERYAAAAQALPVALAPPIHPVIRSARARCGAKAARRRGPARRPPIHLAVSLPPRLPA